MGRLRSFRGISGANCPTILTRSAISSCIRVCSRIIHQRESVPIPMGSLSFSARRERFQEIEFRRWRIGSYKLSVKATLSSESGWLDEVHSVSRVGSALPQRRGHFQEERKGRTDQRVPEGDHSRRGSAGYTILSGKVVSRIRSPSARDQLRDDFGRQREPRTEQAH